MNGRGGVAIKKARKEGHPPKKFLGLANIVTSDSKSNDVVHPQNEGVCCSSYAVSYLLDCTLYVATVTSYATSHTMFT
jgi:hypothetical protein